MRKPVLVFDFDNTLTDGDVLDEVIARFSPNEEWRVWEAEWAEGRMAARECLKLQVENLRVTREALFRHLAAVRLDPDFARILAWARARQVKTIIVSDSFQPMIDRILQAHALEGVPVFANGLEFSGDRLQPSFPHYDPELPRSANAKARHLAPYAGRTIVFAGDGRSDLDAALASDVVFAKDGLARDLSARGVAFRPFGTLAPILDYLVSIEALFEPV